MFICKNCNASISSNTSSYLFTVKQRRKTYPARPGANVYVQGGRAKTMGDPGGRGFETAKALQVCQSCYLKLTEKS